MSQVGDRTGLGVWSGRADPASAMSGLRLLLRAAFAAALCCAASEARAQTHYPVLSSAEINAGAVPEEAPTGSGAHLEAEPVPRMDEPVPLEGALDLRAAETDGAAAGVPRTSGGPLPALEDDFLGITYGVRFPPDPIVAAGPSDLVAMTNGGLAIFTKTGSNTVERTLDAFYNGSKTGSGVFDPKILYDPHSQRFFAVGLDGRSSTAESWLRLAVSKSSEPSNLNVGTSSGDDWWGFDVRADIAGAEDNWADFPGLGVDQDNLYITANMFTTGFLGLFSHARVWVIPKTELLSGATPTVFVFGSPSDPLGGNTTLQPALNFDLTTAHLLNRETLTNLTFWTVNDPTGTPSLSRVSLSIPPISSYSVLDCPQLGGGQPLDTGDARMLNAVQRSGSLWATHTVPVVAEPETVRTAARWYEIDPSGPTLMQSGEITDPDNTDRCLFYPAIHPDAEGNVVVVMSGVGSSIYGSAFYTARSAFDPEGTMRSVAFLREGEASYVQIDSLGRNRWGDYGGIAEDPSTGEIWIFHEYAAPLSQGPNQWNTWFGRLATAGGVCGNGIVESWEECDDTGESAICDTDCTIAECGDGTLNTTAGEECDDGNLVALDGCEPDCTATQDQVLNGRKMVVRDKGGDSSKRKIVVLSRDFGVQVPPVESAGDPTIHSATFRIWNPNDPNKLETFPLPSSGWEALGSPPGSKGYQYRDPDYVNGPCKVVLLKTGKLFRAVCANRSDPPDPITFDLVDSPQEALAASLTLGAEFIDYCMEFGPSTNAEVRKDKPALPDQLGVFKAVNANPPGPCPSP